MNQLFRNLRLTLGTVREHLTDDPALLALQVSRRLSAARVRPAAGLAAAASDRAGLPVPSALAALVLGREHRVRAVLGEALDDPGLSPGRARALADLALLAGDPESADRLLDRAAGAPRWQGAVARRLWHDGEASSAVAILRGARSSAERRQGARLAAELRVLNGWTPALLPVPYEPLPHRVLHVLTNSLPHTPSGYAQRTHSLLLAQREAGWDPLAVTRIGYPVQIGRLTARPQDQVDGIRYRRILLARLEPGLDGRLQQQANAVLKLALEFRPSVLHTTTHHVNALVTRAVAEALGIPWVYEVRGQLADTWASARGPEALRSERYGLFREREAEAARAANLVVTLGGVMKSNLVEQGVPAEKILVAPNAVGGEFLEEPLSPGQARGRLGLDPETPLIGTVSSLVGYEGINDLVTAFGILAADRARLGLLIVGDGAELPALREKVRRAGLQRRVTFTGRVPRGQAHLHHQALDVFVVPRKDRAVTRAVTPLKPVEAMASARPVVASRLPALEEIVQDGITGLLAPPEEPAALASTLGLLLDSGSLQHRLGAAGRSEALAHRTWTSNAVALGRAYDNLREAVW
ncbi:glycosyltransferase [Arthrobacter woluwensis]|uniref:glycosyltransferase n=1 Tax=Arthrobacter woluwensis TaxID=156980 RepID=UPI00382B578F